MIERAVFSYFNPDESYNNTAGFVLYADMLYTMALSSSLAMRHFKEVQIVTSTWGEKVFKEVGIPATEYSTELDSMKSVSKWFWAYGKLIAYNLQTKPFVHIDNDIFLWKPLPRRVLEADLCFQSKEFFNRPGYGWYDVLKPCWKTAPVRPDIILKNEPKEFVYNCGICGGHSLEFFKEWIQCSSEYIFAPENHDVFFKEFKLLLMHQNLFHEQYFAVSLINAHNLADRVQVIADNVEDIVKASNNGYTHLWGTTKRGKVIMERVKDRLKKEDPVLFDKVTKFVNLYLQHECRKEGVKITI